MTLFFLNGGFSEKTRKRQREWVEHKSVSDKSHIFLANWFLLQLPFPLQFVVCLPGWTIMILEQIWHLIAV